MAEQATNAQIKAMTAAEFAAYKKKMGMDDSVKKNHLIGKSSLNPGTSAEHNYGGAKIKKSSYYSQGGTVFTGR
jgi:hypothetical protein